MQKAYDHIFSFSTALKAGRLIRRARRLSTGDGDKAANYDKAADDLIRDLIRQRYPDDAILSEESADSKNRLERSRVWIVDPLDGSADCYRGGREWAIHVALFEDGQLAAGTVCAPDLHLVSCTGYPNRPVPAPRGDELTIALSKSRTSSECLQLVRSLGASPIYLSSAGVKTLFVINGRADAYIHSGGQYEWDSAAPVAVAKSEGLHSSKLDGETLQYNKCDPHVDSVLICRPEHADRIINAYRKITSRGTNGRERAMMKR